MKILVEEDEVLLGVELEFQIAQEGHASVGHALDSGAAVEMLRGKSPDLALIDLHLLDGPTGISVARYAVEEAHALALFMTANQTRLPDDFAGACGVVGKPYTRMGYDGGPPIRRRVPAERCGDGSRPV